jgi:hypothetical protein
MESFHDFLQKEHPWAFYDVQWGLYKEMPTNNHGQSDIVSHTTNIGNKEYCKLLQTDFSLHLADKQELI